MEITLPYGAEKSVAFAIPDRNVLFVAERSKAEPMRNLESGLRRALMLPVGTPKLSRMINRDDDVLIIVDDNTRLTPQNILLPPLVDEINALGIKDERIEILVALGTHRRMSESELAARFGSEIMQRVTVTNHDCMATDKLSRVGETDAGNPIIVNSKVVDADFVIGVGNIAPHCYAGWSGGGKIVQPGVAAEETVAALHMTAARTKPYTELIGRLDQAVRREIDSAALKSGLSLIVNTILNEQDRIANLAVGHPVEAFNRGVKLAEKIYCCEVPTPADVVVVSSYPNDIDYWQASKALTYASLATKIGGTVVLVTPCTEGVSPTHPAFGKRGALSYEENVQAIEHGKIRDNVAAADLLWHAQILQRNDVICCSHGLKQSDKESLGLRHAETMEQAMEMALETQGKGATIGILRCGEMVPRVTSY